MKARRVGAMSAKTTTNVSITHVMRSRYVQWGRIHCSGISPVVMEDIYSSSLLNYKYLFTEHMYHFAIYITAGGAQLSKWNTVE